MGAFLLLWQWQTARAQAAAPPAPVRPEVTIAIIDTGLDLDHELLKSKVKTGTTDEEGHALRPDFDVSPFLDNSHLKQSVLSGTPLQEVLMYRELKAKSYQQGLSAEESNWLERKKLEPEFQAQLKKFKRHVHGTIVAGIALKEGTGLSVFPVRGLGVDVPTLVVEEETEATAPLMKNSESAFYQRLKLSEQRVIRKMGRMLDFIALHKIPIVNASYGITEASVSARLAETYKETTGLSLDPLKLKEIVNDYFTHLYAAAGALIDRHPRTLFVFSAGNSGIDNDVHPHFPSKIRRDNVLTVAASNGTLLAPFSNWGKLSVDIAAPGVAVTALLPSVYTRETGLANIPASGTSMAAPFVANVAARCLQLNPNLTGAEIKHIILETGDALPALTLKLVSGKRIGPERALRAAELSVTMPLNLATQAAMVTTESNILKELVPASTPPAPTPVPEDSSATIDPAEAPALN